MSGRGESTTEPGVGTTPSEPALRLLAPTLAAAVQMAHDGVASTADIDLAMMLGARHPAGPIAIAARLDPATRERNGIPDPPVQPSRAQQDVSASAPWSDAPVGVVGSGFMATGIAYTTVTAGQTAVLLARSQSSAQRAQQRVEAMLRGAVERGRLGELDARRALERLRVETVAQELSVCRLIIEAVAEDLSIKRRVFSRLDESLSDVELLATNTSSLRVADIAAGVAHPERVGALHFFSPVPAMRLVEIVATPQLPPALLERSAAWVRSIGKQPVRCVDRAGFIVNSLLIPFLNDVARELDEGDRSADELDHVITEGAGHPMGPLQLLDFIGLDVSLAAQRAIHAAVGQDRLRPANSLVRHVAADELGRKSGRGYYDYATR